MMKKLCALLLMLCMVCVFAGCSSTPKPAEKKTIKIAAAASLEKILVQKLIPMYQEANPNVKLEGTYASSGKLQTQIEQGMNVDVFISAANKQMQALNDKGFIASSKPLLKNELVLIVPKTNSNPEIKAFTDFTKAKHPAVGDPKSVPAGQYAKEALTNLKLWNDVEKKLSLGTNVVEVLNWVAEGSADAGLVYATDAVSNGKVKIIAPAPQGSLKKPVIYPVGILKKSANAQEAAKLVEFFNSDKAQKVFQEYGFKKAQ